MRFWMRKTIHISDKAVQKRLCKNFHHPVLAIHTMEELQSIISNDKFRHLFLRISMLEKN